MSNARESAATATSAAALNGEAPAETDARGASAQENRRERAPGQGTTDRRNEQVAEALATAVASLDAYSAELTDAEIQSRLAPLWSSTLVDLLYSHAKEQLQAEERRQILLVGKANSLIGALSITGALVFTFGANLVKTAPSVPLIIAYVAALLFALATGICAMVAVRVRDTAAVGSAGLFHQPALAEADSADVPKPQHGSVNTPTGEGTAGYKRFLIPYLWKVFAKNSEKHAETAKWVWRGQIAYSVFLAVIFFTGLLFAYSTRASSEASTPPAVIVSAGDWCGGL